MWRFAIDDFFFRHAWNESHSRLYVHGLFSRILFFSWTVGLQDSDSGGVDQNWSASFASLSKNRRESSRTTVYIYTREGFVSCMSEEEVIDCETSHWNKHRGREKKRWAIGVTIVTRNYSCCWHVRSLDLDESSFDTTFLRWVRKSLFWIRWVNLFSLVFLNSDFRCDRFSPIYRSFR